MADPKFKVGEILERTCVGGDYAEGYRFTVIRVEYDYARNPRHRYIDQNGSRHSENCLKKFANAEGVIQKEECSKPDCPQKDNKSIDAKDLVVGEKYIVIDPTWPIGSKGAYYVGISDIRNKYPEFCIKGNNLKFSVFPSCKFYPYKKVEHTFYTATKRHKKSGLIVQAQGTYTSEDTCRRAVEYDGFWEVIKIHKCHYDSEVDG